jgi:Tfp pilus assembly protein FimT
VIIREQNQRVASSLNGVTNRTERLMKLSLVAACAMLVAPALAQTMSADQYRAEALKLAERLYGHL